MSAKVLLYLCMSVLLAHATRSVKCTSYARLVLFLLPARANDNGSCFNGSHTGLTLLGEVTLTHQPRQAMMAIPRPQKSGSLLVSSLTFLLLQLLRREPGVAMAQLQKLVP